MSIQTTEWRMCDLCGTEIKDWASYGNAMIDGMSNNQIWPIANHRVYDVCGNCCKVIFRAASMGMIDFDMGRLYLALGWKKRDGFWESPNLREATGETA